MTNTKNLPNWETKIDFIKDTLANSRFADFFDRFPGVVEVETRNFLTEKEFNFSEEEKAEMWNPKAESLMRQKILKYFAKIAKEHP